MKLFPHVYILLLLVLVALPACKSPPPVEHEPPALTNAVPQEVVLAPIGLSTHTIYHEGRERYYLLYKPASVATSKAAPVVMAFHGGGGVPENMMEMTGFNILAEHHGFIAVYPSGSGSTPRRLFWNILLSETYATENGVDDLGFITRVLHDVTSTSVVDTNRIFAAGFSQGGMLCYRLACDAELSGRFAAIAVVSGTMTVSPASCHAQRPVPVISFHGKQDMFSNFAGGVAQSAPRNDQVARPGVSESIRYWVAKGGLPMAPSASGARGMARMEQFGPNESGFEVVSWSLENGGHTWPGSNANLPEWMMGEVNRDVEASVMIWDFFSRHPRR